MAGPRMRINAAFVCVFLCAAPAWAQEITNVRDANGNLPRDKGISTNTNPTNARAGNFAQSFSTQGLPTKPAVTPVVRPPAR
jgi:hypothetical protein